LTLRWECDKQGCYKDSLPDWAMLDGCFGARGSATDLDGIVERHGKCLILEKKFPDGLIEKPQRMVIEALVAQGNACIAFWCERPDGMDTAHLRVWGIDGYDSEVRYFGSLAEVRRAAARWWEHGSEKRRIYGQAGLSTNA
jgi:hypothetical protein